MIFNDGDYVTSGTGGVYRITKAYPNDYRGDDIMYAVAQNTHLKGNEMALYRHSAKLIPPDDVALMILKGEI